MSNKQFLISPTTTAARPPLPSDPNSPWRNSGVPIEVWGEVFREVIADTKLKMADQVNVCCLVCKEWREAALATPRLWTNLQVGIGTRTTFSKLNSWLTRSRALPKRVRLIELRGAPLTPLAAYGEVARFLVEGPVLEKLCLQVYSMHSFQDIIDRMEPLSTIPVDRAWDSLRFFALDICGWDDPEDGPYRHTSFLHLPLSLTHLSLNLPWYRDFMGEQEDIPPSISLPNLTNLYIECDWPTTWVLKTVTSCRAVQTLTLRTAKTPRGHDDVPFNMNRRYPLPKLHTLRLRSDEWWYTYSDVLRPLVLPSLTHLDISRDNRYDAPEEEAPWVPEKYGDDIETLAQRSDSLIHLQHIRLHFPKERGGTVDLAPILRRLPLVTHLTMDDTNFERTLFQQGSQLLPRLRSLELVGQQPAFDYVSLTEFCEERRSTRPGFIISRRLSSNFSDEEDWDIKI